mgnify:FL=1
MNEIYDEEIKELEDEILLDMQEDDAEEYEDAPKHKYKKSTIIAIGQDKPLAAKERHYVSKEDFFNAIVKRKALLKTYQEKLEQGLDVKKPQISNEIGEYIVKICTNLSKKSNFAKKRYDGFRADMIGDAIEQCVRYIDSFNPEVSNNPFSYFTQTAYYRYIDRIKVEDKETYLKYKSIMNSLVLSELSEQDTNENAEHIHDNIELPDISHITEFIEKYERLQAEAVKKVKVKKKSVMDDIFGD